MKEQLAQYVPVDYCYGKMWKSFDPYVYIATIVDNL